MTEIKNTKNIFSLLSVIFFSTVASMMIISILPVFFKEKLHLNYVQIGFIEGCAAFTAFLSKFLSGIFSDKIQKRKSFIVLGTSLSILTKGCFAIATGFLSVFIVQICDRLAKGMRSCPSDAMIADLSDSKNSGLYYGLKYTFFMAGSILGSCITYNLLKIENINLRVIFSLAMIPAGLAYFIAFHYIHESPPPEPKNAFFQSFSLKNLIFSLNSTYWRLLIALFLLMFARFSISFLALKVRNQGIPVTTLPHLLILYDCCAATAALISGGLLYLFKKEYVFEFSLLIHIIAHLLFLISSSKSIIIFGTVLSGFHIGMSQGLILTLISNLTTPQNRASAFSIYYLVAGIGIFFSNILAGKLSTIFHSPSGAFLGGSFFCLLSFLYFHYFIKPKYRTESLQI